MIRRKYFTFLFIVVVFSFTGFKNASSYKIYTSSFENVLGTSLDMKFSALNEESADRAEETAIKEIKRLNAILSSYDNNSIFSKWVNTSHQSTSIPQELKEVLQNFENWSSLTNGMLSPAIAPLDKIWKDAAMKQTLPSSASIAEAVKITNQQHWILNPNENSATHLTNTHCC